MRQTAVCAEFDTLRVDQDELRRGGSAGSQERCYDSVDYYGLAASGCACDKQVRLFRHVFKQCVDRSARGRVCSAHGCFPFYPRLADRVSLLYSVLGFPDLDTVVGQIHFEERVADVVAVFAVLVGDLTLTETDDRDVA